MPAFVSILVHVKFITVKNYTLKHNYVHVQERYKHCSRSSLIEATNDKCANFARPGRKLGSEQMNRIIDEIIEVLL